MCVGLDASLTNTGIMPASSRLLITSSVVEFCKGRREGGGGREEGRGKGKGGRHGGRGREGEEGREEGEGRGKGKGGRHGGRGREGEEGKGEKRREVGREVGR